MTNTVDADAPALYVPPEEGAHSGTFMQWPSSVEVYRERGFLEHVQRTIANIANAIAEFEPVIMLASDADYRSAKRLLSANVEHWNIPTEDLWCRDSGPLFAFKDDGSLAVSHIAFNGWGEKQVHTHDGQIASRVAERLGVPLISSGLAGEAGGVEHDGHGLLMAHESSWVNENRNPGLSRDEIEARLLQAYGASQMVWMPGLAGEDITDYHIDSLARFTGPARVLINLPQDADPSDEFQQTALESFDILSNRDVDVDVIHEPAYTRIDSEDFVASYVNYYVCNGAVIAAAFGDDAADHQAVEALRRHYPGREVVTLNVDALGEVGGGIHCATQQMPEYPG
jgi:agmatine deiminase